MTETLNISFTHKVHSTIEWEMDSFGDHFASGDTPCRVVVDNNARWYFDEFIAPKLNGAPIWEFKDPEERKKSEDSVREIHQFLFQESTDRTAVIIAVGGGITLDTAGFAASTFKRGIEWIAIPTTLLAQVDASVGGKTGINHKEYGKNVVGAFHPPRKVFIDPACSTTWTDELRREGIAEMYKIFKVFDHAALERLLTSGPSAGLTKRSIEIKTLVVKADPYEANIRAILNYGHTVGHAIETLCNTEEQARLLPHGIAVAIGMRIENHIAACLGIMSAEAVEAAERELDALGFPRPRELPELNEVLALMLQDKKTERNTIRIACVDGVTERPIDNCDPRVAVSVDTVKQGIERYLAGGKS